MVPCSTFSISVQSECLPAPDHIGLKGKRLQLQLRSPLGNLSSCQLGCQVVKFDPWDMLNNEEDHGGDLSLPPASYLPPASWRLIGIVPCRNRGLKSIWVELSDNHIVQPVKSIKNVGWTFWLSESSTICTYDIVNFLIHPNCRNTATVLVH